ncbi:TIGR03032 family protein [Gynuella sunshinyii]|uniref:Conserved hypothetical protein CHP03032 domain-containing protein n=1 Tax=Gynuella sunshinyii YC6258 TaxID=1445510 RepID=A0A0C5VGL9_9GAMM|nr:TIGR03032 family protein [Gynuella sunshinyii]AJQ93341.1 hypothetical Protein YC6258_01293 [Gynuella sunshinyii YC6258]
MKFFYLWDFMSLAKYSADIPEYLRQLGIALVITSNTAGRIFTLSSDGHQVNQTSVRVRKPMGIALNGEYMAISNFQGVTLYKNDKRSTGLMPENPFSRLFYPMTHFVSYGLNHHDLAFTRHGLISVNTTCACLGQVDTYGEYGFKTFWKPEFISRLSPEDCCHLNGMAVDEEGEIRYVTAFSTNDVGSSWRENVMAAGVVINVQTGATVLDGFTMPHSPRWYNNRLYFFSSATEELFEYFPEQQTVNKLFQFDGFIRGLDFAGQYAFIGVSRLRKSRAFGFLPIVEKVIRPGVVVFDLQARKVVGEIVFPDGVDEIFDVKVLPDTESATVYDPNAPGAMKAIISESLISWIREDN